MNLSNVHLHYLLVICLKMHVELNDICGVNTGFFVGGFMLHAYIFTHSYIYDALYILKKIIIHQQLSKD